MSGSSTGYANSVTGEHHRASRATGNFRWAAWLGVTVKAFSNRTISSGVTLTEYALALDRVRDAIGASPKGALDLVRVAICPLVVGGAVGATLGAGAGVGNFTLWGWTGSTLGAGSTLGD